MDSKFPTPEDRKRLLHSFYDLSPKDKKMLYRAVEHLRWLTMLWDLEKLSHESMLSISEKRHILLAYKLLQILWFSKLPEKDDQTFRVYVRDRLPDDQDPQTVNDIFDTNSDELAVRSDGVARPEWLTKEAKAMMVSLESFPSKAS
ncbi:MAG TPA: hypothetical protein V6D48_07695 [Oculatellaceae cyanobacterium]